MGYCVGLTGNIASGKTTVSELFSKLGIDVVHADVIAKALTQKKLPAYDAIVAHYGPHILQHDEELNRTKMREIIFFNHEERKWLEHLLHPLIRKELKIRIDASTTPYCIVEIPLLVTKKAFPYINSILLVQAPTEIQLFRIMKRDRCSKEQALAILSTQPDASVRLKNADDVLSNHLGLEELEKAVNRLHHKYFQESRVC